MSGAGAGSAAGRALRDRQHARFAALDPLLPATAPTIDGETLTAKLPGGGRVAGVLTKTTNGPGTLPSLWSARQVWELYPLVGQEGAAGVDALLGLLRELLGRLDPEDPDTACVVTWPSRDVLVSRVLLDHGLVPLSVLAVRTDTEPEPEPVTPMPGVVVRRARPADLNSAVQLALAELSYSAKVGGTVERPDAAALKRQSLGYRIAHEDPIFLAERDGVVLGLAECWLTEGDPTAVRRFPVPPGRWGYVNTVSVLPGARGSGVGRTLVSVVHQHMRQAGTAGSYLYYNPPNPLASVFWPRHGYRPLWTVWEVRPATALR
jgi:ribosomal protein S18 acetylase RimI-like enzyme